MSKTIQLFLLFLTSAIFAYGQNFKTEVGGVEALAGVERYNVIFEFADELEIPGYTSENAFVETYARKAEKREAGAGQKFKDQWISYRTDLYGPKFIQEFNFFNLKEKQVTVATNISDAGYTMVVRTTSITPGNSNFFFKKNAWLRVYIRIYKTGHPEEVLYSTQAVEVHSNGANSSIFNRIMSAYAELGRGLSKHLSRKT